MSYYGTRGVFTLYLIKHLHQSPKDSFSIYMLFLSGYYLLMIPGGILGDFLIGKKLSMLIGTICQSIGCFILCLQPALQGFYIGAGFIYLGSALYSPNLLAQFTMNYQSNSGMLQSGVYLFYAFLNIGAMIGPLIIGFYNDADNFFAPFLIYGLISLASGLIPFLSSRKTEMNKKVHALPISGSAPAWSELCIALLSIPLFWAMYDIISGSLYSSAIQAQQHMTILLTAVLFTIIACIIGAILFAFFRFSYLLLIGSGTVLMVVLILLLIYSPAIRVVSEKQLEINTTIIVLNLALLTLAESLFSPVIILIAGRNLPVRFLSTGMGIMLATSVLQRPTRDEIGTLIDSFSFNFIMFTVMGILILFAAFWFAMARYQKKVET
ncbi:MAG TPA: MFS transporter [Bacteroidia bacterium]|nr:MFS transporter [Bacteroidia bacterium]